MALPMPREAPVMNSVLPRRLVGFVMSVSVPDRPARSSLPGTCRALAGVAGSPIVPRSCARPLLRHPPSSSSPRCLRPPRRARPCSAGSRPTGSPTASTTSSSGGEVNTRPASTAAGMTRRSPSARCSSSPRARGASGCGTSISARPPSRTCTARRSWWHATGPGRPGSPSTAGIRRTRP